MTSALLELPNISSRFSENASIVVYEGDTEVFLKTLPNSSISLIITSPPYNLGKEYESKVDIESYLEGQSATIQQLIRVLNNQGSLCWQVGNWVNNGEVFPLDIFYYRLFKDCGLKLRNRIVWHFEHGLHCSKRFSGRYEVLLWFTKSDDYIFNLDPVRVPSKYPGKTYFKGPKHGKPSGNPLGKNPSDLWRFVSEEWEREVWEIPNVKSNHPEKTIHPCQFPIELVERCVLALTAEHEWVLDPYCGVGSALIAAVKQGRKAIGCDKERRYIQETHSRLMQFFNGTLKLRQLGKGVHVPTGKEKVCQTPKEWEAPLFGDDRS
ncbi:MAG: DNA-methyltransferase [Terriglobia bacterium]